MVLIDLGRGCVNWVTLRFSLLCPWLQVTLTAAGYWLGGYNKSERAGMFANIKSMNCEHQLFINTNIHVIWGSWRLSLLVNAWSARRHSMNCGDGGGRIVPEISAQTKGGFSLLVLNQGKMFIAETYSSRFVSCQDGVEGKPAGRLAGFIRLLALSRNLAVSTCPVESGSPSRIFHAGVWL